MLPFLLTSMIMFDAWVGPNTTGTPPPGYTIRKVTPYTKLNSSGTTWYYGGNNPGYGTPSPTYKLNRTVVVNNEALNGWGQPSWTTPYATLGDFSITQNATPDPNLVTAVLDGQYYVHDVYIKNVSTIQSFSGYDGQNHSAARGRSWDTLDHEDRYAES